MNTSAVAAGVGDRIGDSTYRLVLQGPGVRRELGLAELGALPQTTVSLPITCVEGWSASAVWTGVLGASTDDGVDLVGVVEFLATILIGHDLVVLPVAIGVGFLVARYVPAGIRGWLQGGLFASAVLTVISIPLLAGAGRIADNPTRLPLDYGRGLAIVLGVIWLITLGGAVWSRHQARPAQGRE